MEADAAPDYKRVVMVFDRAGLTSKPVGKHTGERGRIDEISPKPLPLIYASDLADEQMRDHLRNASDNIFRQGFVVDVNVQEIGGKARAYRITQLHQVIDFDDD